MSFKELCLAVFYSASFESTWLQRGAHRDTVLVRTRFLRRNMIERGRLAKALTAIAVASSVAGCLTIAVKSPDGSSSASYYGTSIVGGEDVSCGTTAGVVTCSGSGQNVAGLAQAIAPYLAQIYGLPVSPAPAAPRPTPTPTLEVPAR